MRGHDLAVLDDAADDLVGVLFELQLFVSFLDEVGLDRESVTTWKMSMD